MKSISTFIIGILCFIIWVSANDAQTTKYMVHGLSFNPTITHEQQLRQNDVEIEVLRAEIAAKILEIYYLIDTTKS